MGVHRLVAKEEALALEAHRRRCEAWLKDNREAIEAYNEHVAQHGVFSAGIRSPRSTFS